MVLINFVATNNGSVGCFPSVAKNINDDCFRTPQSKKVVPTSKSPPSHASNAKKETPLKSNNGNSNSSIFGKPDCSKSSNLKIEISESKSLLSYDDNTKKCVPFVKVNDEKVQNFGGLRSESRVIPFHDNEENLDVDENLKDMEDLSLIREQLAQIEDQQSNLLNLLQKFIGSSQSGINSLETRVNGLEMALDEISYDLAISSGRIPNTDSPDNTCCKLPDAEFLSPKFWRKTEGRFSTSRIQGSQIEHQRIAFKTQRGSGLTTLVLPMGLHRFDVATDIQLNSSLKKQTSAFEKSRLKMKSLKSWCQHFGVYTRGCRILASSPPLIGLGPL
ncbi:ARM repeat superfamily protein, putative isoform 2 [Hibiscus syriacus]|uniref:ARM repeat superfamily protein, putative isoform 2 n=1 Tax=Hibiscus syriacus TaxID=106335 RepID=A0A6A2ZB28_HIBSY|nr:ARM repeat superfamily protein, putative isoform 2 [Hibiscus syriacus]